MPDQPRDEWETLRWEESEEDRRRWRRRLQRGLIPLMLLIAIVIWISYPRPVAVTVYRVVPTDPIEHRTVLSASGYVTARRQATVSSKITARIQEVLVEEGQRVKKGQILARLDDSNIRRNLALAKARVEEIRKQVEEARAQWDLAEKELQRIERLFQNHVVSQSDLDQARAARDAWRARTEALQRSILSAEKEVQVWEQQLEDTIIRAPFDGVVTTKDAHPGEMISPVTAGGGYTRTGICTIVDMTSLEIEVDVNESMIERVHPGQEVVAHLDAYPEWAIPAHVIAIVPTADREKSTIKVRIGFDHLDPRILPEMSIRVAFLDDRSNQQLAPFYIPANAVHSQNGRHWVWKIVKGRAVQAEVRVGQIENQEIGVFEGLKAGDWIVVQSAKPLQEGVRVRFPAKRSGD